MRILVPVANLAALAALTAGTVSAKLPPPSEDASVSLAPSGDQGDISARRDGGSRRIQLPGALSPGSWRLFIGSSDAGPLEVRPGEAIVIECKRAFGTCRRR